jgi:hypothetical protein
MMSVRRKVAFSIAAVLFAGFCLGLALCLLPGAADMARADGGPADRTGGEKVAVFEDVIISADQAWDNVVVVGGDLIVEGSVANSVVVVGGDLTIRSSARIGFDARDDAHHDASVVSVFGSVTVESGATVSGRVVDVAGGFSDAVKAAFVDPVVTPWKWSSIVGWIVSTIFLAVAALVVVAIAPRQIAAVRDRARRHLFSSLGWGALGLIIGVPLITILLIITVVGILVVVPWLAIVVPILLLFGFVGLAALLGRLILGEREDRRGQVMFAAVLGVVILCVVRWIPVAGAVVGLFAVLVGLGAVITAIWEWNRRPRSRDLQAAAQPGAADWQQTDVVAPVADMVTPTAGESAVAGDVGGQEPPVG